MGKAKKKKDADWEDDVLAELDDIDSGVAPKEEEKQEKKGKKKGGKDAEEPAEAGAAASASTSPEPTSEGAAAAAADAKPSADDVKSEAVEASSASAGGKGKDKKKKKKKKDDDWENDVLAELEDIDAGVAPKEEEKQEKKGKKKGGKDVTADASPESAAAASSQATSEGASAAAADAGETAEGSESKKKKKKKKGAASAMPQPAAAKASDAGETADAAAASTDGAAAAASPAAEGGDQEGAAAEAGGEAGGEDDAEGASSSKKKKKKKADKKAEDDKKDKKRKGPQAKAIALMKAQLEEQKRLQAEFEEAETKRIAEEEEQERIREEKTRVEKEKKEKKKLKEKERRERLRKEGKLLSKTEKERRQRAQAQLEALRATGIEIPAASAASGDKPKVRYGSRARNKPKPGQQGATPTDDTGDRKVPTVTVEGNELQEKEGEERTASRSDASDDERSWDAISTDEEGASANGAEAAMISSPKKARPTAQKPEAQRSSSGTASANEDADDSDEESDSDESSEEESESESESEESSTDDDDMTPREKAEHRIMKRQHKFKLEQEKCQENLEFRAPVVCVLGHVDTGKTKILDKLRHTNVQDGEAGGITQQIGATNVPLEAIEEQTKMCKEFLKFDLRLPGLLIIDTPGHESFSNLRSRGSSLCDIAVLVVDIMHGLEPQTIESLNLLKKRKTPFIVALNKIDRLFEWRRNPQSSVKNTIAKQKLNTRLEFEEHAKEVIVQFAEQGMNAAISYDNKDLRRVISLVPTSAITGDGMGDLIALLCELSQKNLPQKLAYTQDVFAQVLEVKSLAGLGMCLDVILVQGELREGQTIVLCGMDGAFHTTIRALLMPQPMKEFRVKGSYQQEKVVKAAQGVRICGKDLEKTIAGTPLLIAYQQDEIEVLKSQQEATLKAALTSIKTEERGVYVQASTMGALEALLEFLKTSKIPYSGVAIGPVHKKDIMRCGVMLEHDAQYAVVLAFDVKVEREAQEMADSTGVKIFTADIIYHLFDAFMAYRAEYLKSRQDQFRHIAVFPCKLRILPDCVFNKRDPIIVGVVIEEGSLHVGTPICVPTKEFVYIGNVSSIEFNHKVLEVGKKGQEVCIKIDHVGGDAPKMVGRHFEATDKLVSRINRESIDACKNYFRDDMTRSDWLLVKDLKKVFGIF